MKHLPDWLKTIVFLAIATLCSLLFHLITNNTANIAIVYMLSIVLITKYTEGYRYGVIGSAVGVIGVNYFFTFPYLELDFTRTGYPITFLGMLAISFITSTTVVNLQAHQRLNADAEKEKMRANLLRAISHDLRTPLTGMIGASATYIEMKDNLTEEEKDELILHIHEDSNWLLHMVENLLSVTRIHSNNTTVTKVSEPVEEVVSEAVMRLKKRYPNAKILVKTPDEFLMVPMDATLIEQVMINLLENAYKYSKSKKPIELTVTKEPNFVRFSIMDYGVGINKDTIYNFFEGNTATKNTSSDSTKGMGIGLSICKTIIRAHGGVIEASNHSNGASFTFTLPLD
ncbi:sensor histidine kinase [Lachnoclostridium phytofermentans]|uniref:histidine kinase n=1 Tax=Lachnoclostridium phytofermentans (strain ATCC 700394 / DSM 18823 / ISDg) TaxID=357809 RepID=A9KJX5_LACP7|nr:DUF4118 domain-containing protein [Lachnoclostridium phytofermentans]ABX41130.1 integral membrane sensor signal transduction histidine kinase [Lachnoclostridium phytofermentans ISDg]